MAEMIQDQYAFRPTGSTLVDLLQKLTDLLRENEYVVLATVDFSMAFDCVKHMPLLEKMNLLKLSYCIYNWMVRYFESRGPWPFHQAGRHHLIIIVGAFDAEGCRFDSTSSRHVGTLGKSITRNCLYDGCGALWLPGG